MPSTTITPTPQYKYYPLVMAGFVTVLLCSNLIGPGKSCVINLHMNVVPKFDAATGWSWAALLTFGAGNMFFPISYIFDDVLTEVYGYAKARKVIWAGFGAMLFAAIMSTIVIRLPADPNEPFNKLMQPALEVCFGAAWRIVLASMLAFWAGDFVNSYVLAKMKILTKGKHLWTRTIGSTIVGEGVDSLLFYPIALMSLEPVLRAVGVTDPQILANWGGWTTETTIKVITFNWIFKVCIEVLFTPLTYLACNWLKKAEGVDHYDRDTDFTPFSLKD